MKKVAIGLLFMIFLLPACAFAQTVTSTDLIDRAKELDGQTVTFTGEVIGDIMRRGDYAWLNVSDGSNAIGVWVPTAMIGDIQAAGRYAEHGDEVRLTGVFNRACREHGGDLDIHATQVELLEAGYATEHAIEPGRVVLAVVLTLADLGILARLLSRK